MFRGIAAALFALLLTMGILPSSSMAEAGKPMPLSVVSAYYLDGSVHITVRPEGDAGLEKLEASLTMEGAVGDARVSPEPVSSVKYLMLADCSASMSSYRWMMTVLGAQLFEESAVPATVSLAGFGERFEVFQENLSSEEELRSALSKLSFSHQSTDICGGLTEAVQYFAGLPQNAGESKQILLLTDGSPYLTGDPALEEQAIAASAEAALEAVSEAAEIAVHTVCFSDWESVTFSAVSSGTGLNLQARNVACAQQAGAKIRRFSDSLCDLTFPVKWSYGENSVDAQLILTAEDLAEITMVPVNGIRDVGTPLEMVAPNRPALVLPESAADEEPGADGEPEPGEEPQPKDRPGTDGGAAPEEETDTPVAEEPGAEIPEGEDGARNEKLPASEKTEEENGRFPVGLAAAGIALLAAVFVGLAFLMLRGKGEKKAPPSAVAMKLEVLSGSCKKDGRMLFLADQLLIGSGKGCDIVFADRSMPARCARLFLQEQTVCLEDLNSNTRTSIGGMKIFAPNRLRSGDEIRIGDVRFRLWF